MSECIHVWLAEGEDAETWVDRIGELCGCRRRWWQLWRRRHCFFDGITIVPVEET